MEAAAKAAGYEYKYHSDDKCVSISLNGELVRYNWNPIDDDADSLRLSVKLMLSIDIRKTSVTVEPHVFNMNSRSTMEFFDDNANSRAVSTRLAIVRAAAEAGKSMP